MGGPCFHCGERGHWANECPKKSKAAAAVSGGTASDSAKEQKAQSVGVAKGQSSEETDTRIFLPYLPEKMSEEMLKVHFGRFGMVVDVFIPVAKTAKEKRIAFVSYQTHAEAMACARQPRQMINNKVVEVYKASPKPGGGKAEPPMGAKGSKAGGKVPAMAFRSKK